MQLNVPLKTMGKNFTQVELLNEKLKMILFHKITHSAVD